MATPHIWTPIKRWLRNTSKRLYTHFSRWLRRLLHRVAPPRRRRSQRRVAGFVLPTAVMLLLVLSLIVGAILLRTINRTEQVMLSRRDRIIYNAATPAIDRAKAKLEFMFDRSREPRLPQGIPAENLLVDIMLNQVAYDEADDQPVEDPYTLPGETRIDINGDGDIDNAWVYSEDSNGDGENDVRVAYSIIMKFPDDNPSLRDRARGLFVRQGPVSSQPAPGCGGSSQAELIESGWLRDGTSTALLRKNFQINALVISGGEDRAVTTLEVQQEREANRMNKWGAWFRNDLEIFPGQEFRWNGAMHTAGNFMIGDRRSTDLFQAYLVSGPGSCIYQAGPTTSEISVADDEEFTGQVMVGFMPEDINSGGGIIHIYREEDPRQPNINDDTTLTPQNDSVESGLPSDVALDPIILFTQDRSQHRRPNAVRRRGDWDQSPFVTGRRIVQQQSNRPFIDDFYRADDRYGPVPVYGGEDSLQLIRETRMRGGEPTEIGLGVRVAEPIANSSASARQKSTLLRLDVDDEDEDPRELGLDGYWERRAWREGMRVIVGQRLELGNDPFASPTEIERNSDVPQRVDDRNLTRDREHESLQRRSFRDNLAAAQTTAIYHWSEGADDANEPPVAGILTTVHPGTAETLKRGAIFNKPQINDEGQFGVDSAYSSLFGSNFGDDDDELLVDFFTGRGTNGWELDVSNLDITNPRMVDALENLANFAGDPDGAFPAVQRSGEIHPNPALTEWGNFSNLRRTLSDDLESLADYTNKHTAAMTLGALAYNVSYLDALDYGSVQTELQDLADRLEMLRDANLTNGEVVFLAEKPSNAQWTALESQLGLSSPSTYDRTTINIFDTLPDEPSLLMVDDSGNVIVRTDPTPETYIEALQYTGAGFEPYQELARLIYLKEQVKRDRKFGFLPSETANANYQLPSPSSTLAYQTTYQVNVSSLNLTLTAADIEADLRALASGAICQPGLNLNDCLDTVTINTTTNEADVTFLPGWGFGTSSATIDLTTGALNLELSFGCDVEDHNFFGLGDTAAGITLANNLCGATPKFPSLYYIFPTDDHGYRNNTSLGEEQPQAENDISIDWVADLPQRGIMDLGRDLNNNGSLDDEIWYTSDPYIQTVTTHTYRAFDANGFISMAIKPVAGIEAFTLPYVADQDCPQNSEELDGNPNPNCQDFNLIYDGEREEYHRVAFKDTAFFVGRDRLNSRFLNLDLELLSNKANGQTNGTTPTGGDTWLAGGDDNDDARRDGGLVYAFREDAVREDGIERPPGGSCRTAADIGNGCNTEVVRNIDPQVNPDNGISPKAVNFNPDPDRQIHGFRVIQGEDISRPTGGDNAFGLSFISDNPTFIEGNFNCHKTPNGTCDGNVIEEFTSTLSTQTNWGPAQFYGQRQTINRQDDRFADDGGDSWRYSEFLVDSLGILTENFCDGSIEDIYAVVPATGSNLQINNALVQALGSNDLGRGGSATTRLDSVYGCRRQGDAFTSYSSFLRPNGTVSSNRLWLRENPADLASPIRISSNGNPLAFLGGLDDFDDEGEYNGDNYFGRNLSQNDNLDLRRLLVRGADRQRVNAIIISGIPPSRPQQSYGGLHNFPRFNEELRDTELIISGSLLQLRFSNYATGPYDQDGWEPRGPNSQPVTREVLGYYGPPPRLWGYDVALQLSRVGPVSARQVETDSPRSEFYREPPASDDFILNLRCASVDGETFDPRATDCP